MARLLVGGDTHGNLNHCLYLIGVAQEQGLSDIYQAGDFGFWEHTFKGEKFLDTLNINLQLARKNWYWLDGNHENLELLYAKYDADNDGVHQIRSNIFHMGRGHIKEIDGKNVMFLGGADSVDKRHRTLFVDYWREEHITQKQAFDAVDAAERRGVDILLLHDAPEGNYTIGRRFPAGDHDYWDLEDSLKHRQLLTEIVLQIKPKVIIHGHYHYRYEDTFRTWNARPKDYSAKIYGLNCDNTGADSWMVFDTNKMEATWGKA